MSRNFGYVEIGTTTSEFSSPRLPININRTLAMITTFSTLSFPNIRLAALANLEDVNSAHHIHERFRGLATFF